MDIWQSFSRVFDCRRNREFCRIEEACRRRVDEPVRIDKRKVPVFGSRIPNGAES